MHDQTGVKPEIEPEKREVSLHTGKLLGCHKRRAQARNDAKHSISANLTERGAWVHDIEQSTELAIQIYENGIWITPVVDDG